MDATKRKIEERLAVLVSERETLVSQIAAAQSALVQMTANLNAYHGAIEELGKIDADSSVAEGDRQ
jgi:hypothetical protein